LAQADAPKALDIVDYLLQRPDVRRKAPAQGILVFSLALFESLYIIATGCTDTHRTSPFSAAWAGPLKQAENFLFGCIVPRNARCRNAVSGKPCRSLQKLYKLL
jgi:hypothetical protein